MVKIESVADGIRRLEMRQPGARYVSAAYVVEGDGGVLVEPGPTSVLADVLEGLKQLGVRELAYIIPTHIHMDHAGGTGSLARCFPRAIVVLHPRGARHAIDPTRLIAGTRLAQGDDFESTYGPILPVPESQVYVPEDGETLTVKGRPLRVIHAPGHASHHMAVYDEKTGGLFCGEALGVPERQQAGHVGKAGRPACQGLLAEFQRGKIEHHDRGARESVAQVESDVDAGYGADVSQSVGGLYQPAQALLCLTGFGG